MDECTNCEIWRFAEEFPEYNDEILNIHKMTDDERAKLDPLFLRFGKVVWSDRQTGNDAESVSIYDEISAVYSKIDELSARLVKIDGEAEKEHNRRLEESSKPEEPPVEIEPEAIPEPETDVVCPNCGTLCDDDSKFCKECGTRFPERNSAPVPVSAEQNKPEEIIPEPVIETEEPVEIQPEPETVPEQPAIPQQEPAVDSVNHIEPKTVENACPNCGTVNPDGDKFCQECGAKLGGPTPAPTPAPAPVGNICPKCGKLNANSMKFCQQCGTKLGTPAPAPVGKVCPKCGKVNANGMKFCQQCGTKLGTPAPAPVGKVCPKCGKVNANGMKFCQQCGTKLDASAPAAPQQPRNICPSCKTDNRIGDRFCKNCGTRLS